MLCHRSPVCATCAGRTGGNQNGTRAVHAGHPGHLGQPQGFWMPGCAANSVGVRRAVAGVCAAAPERRLLTSPPPLALALTRILVQSNVVGLPNAAYGCNMVQTSAVVQIIPVSVRDEARFRNRVTFVQV